MKKYIINASDENGTIYTSQANSIKHAKIKLQNIQNDCFGATVTNSSTGTIKKYMSMHGNLTPCNIW